SCPRKRRSYHRGRHNRRPRDRIGRRSQRSCKREAGLHSLKDRQSASAESGRRIADRFTRTASKPSRLAQRVFAGGKNSRGLRRSNSEKISLARVRRFESDLVNYSRRRSQRALVVFYDQDLLANSHSISSEKREAVVRVLPKSFRRRKGLRSRRIHSGANARHARCVGL